MSRLVVGADLARRWGVALMMGVALSGASGAQAKAGTPGDPVSEAVMKARGDISFVRQRVCSGPEGKQLPACATLKDAAGALDQTKIGGETKSSATDLPHAFAGVDASLDDAEHLIGAEPGSSADGSADVLHAVRVARDKVRQAEKETVATPDKDGWLQRLRGLGSSSGGDTQRQGNSILTFVALFFNVVAVGTLAYLAWLRPLARNGGKEAASGGSPGGFNQIYATATKAAADYKTVVDRNERWQAQVKQLRVENLGLQRQLELMQGRGGGRMAAMGADEEFGGGRNEPEESEAVEPALMKYGPGRAPIVLDVGSVGEGSGGERPRQDLEGPGRKAERGSAERREPDVAAADQSTDALSEFRRARQTGDSDEEFRFKKKYAPCLSLTCTNLAQRGIAGGRLTFKEDPRGSFLAATGQQGQVLLFPQFRTEFPYARGLMEGVFVYPDGDIRELNLAQAGELEPAGDEWVLLQPGQFEHA